MSQCLDVIVLHPSRTSRGGIVNAARSQALALAQRGHRVEFWTGSALAAEQARAIGLAAFSEPALASLLGTLTSGRSLAAFAGLRRRKPDAVLHHGARLYVPALLGAPAKAQFAVFHNEKLGGRRNFHNWLALSSRHAAKLRQYSKDHDLHRFIATIPNALAEMPPPAPERGSTPGLGRAVLRVGILAELKPHKGVSIALEAVQLLAAAGLIIELHVGGTGPERERLGAEARDRGIEGQVTWHGWVDDLDRFFGEFEVFCLPSHREPFGLVTIEAMARGKLVIATATDGSSDIISDGRTGFLVSIADAQSLADRLRAAVEDPQRSLDMANAGREHALTAYSPQAVGQRLEVVIEEAIARWR